MTSKAHTAPQPSRRRSPKAKESTSRSRWDITPPSPHKPPQRVQRQMQVEAGIWPSGKKTLQRPMRNATHTHTGKQHSRRRSPKGKKTQVAVTWTSSPPIPPKPPQRVQRQMQVEAGMCRKSRGGQNTAIADTKCDTDRKTPKTKMRNGQLSINLDSAARRLLHFLARELLENTAKTEEKRNLKVNFGRAKCQNSSFSTCQPRNRQNLRGGRRTCCQQQQQQQQQLLLHHHHHHRYHHHHQYNTTTSPTTTTTTTTATTTTTTTTTNPAVLLGLFGG